MPPNIILLAKNDCGDQLTAFDFYRFYTIHIILVLYGE
jgi:hypothetical protein